jgi:hypothetical protein
MMYRMLKDNAYENILHCISPQQPNHAYCTRRTDDFLLPFPLVENVRMNFKYQFLNIWNQIPTEIKASTSHCVFKRKYTNYLLSLY